MNHREPPHLPAGVRKALHCLSLLLLPGLAPDAYGLPRSRPASKSGARPAGAESTPYLAVIGAPPLRFQAPPLPPAPLERPLALMPATPARAVAESSVALANAAATQSASASDSAASTQAAQTPETSAASGKTPAPILSDDVRPTARPEDFLHFFHQPGRQPDDITVFGRVPGSAPAPAAIPPSSATYIQK